jgi:hypothetical protein
MHQWSDARDIHMKDGSPAGEEVASLSYVEKKESLNRDHERTRYTAIALTRRRADMIGLPTCST